MAGKPGRSGGARLGAGRPRNPPVLLDVGRHDAPQAFLLAVIQCGEADLRLRINAAKTLLRYTVTGKKEQAADAAKKAAGGRCAASAPPLKLIRP